MRLRRSVLARYTNSLNGVTEAAKKVLMEEFRKVDFSDMTKGINEVVRIVEEVCGMSAGTSAEIAAAFYDNLRRMQVGAPLGAKAISGRSPDATENAVRAFAGKAVEGDMDMFLRLCQERVAYEIKRAAGESIIRNAISDRMRVRYARVPDGADTCAFCLMLASRGFVYATEESAGADDHYHANCDCRIVPSFEPDTEVDGYDPESLYDDYRDARSVARDNKRAEGARPSIGASDIARAYRQIGLANH